jgi:hypothetical protein
MGVTLEFAVLFEVRTRLAGQIGAHDGVVLVRVGCEIPGRLGHLVQARIGVHALGVHPVAR